MIVLYEGDTQNRENSKSKKSRNFMGLSEQSSKVRSAQRSVHSKCSPANKAGSTWLPMVTRKRGSASIARLMARRAHSFFDQARRAMPAQGKDRLRFWRTPTAASRAFLTGVIFLSYSFLTSHSVTLSFCLGEQKYSHSASTLRTKMRTESPQSPAFLASHSEIHSCPSRGKDTVLVARFF